MVSASGASLAFALDAVHKVWSTRSFHYMGFITPFFVTSSQIPTPSQSQAEHVFGVQSWLLVGLHGPQ